MIHIPAQGPDPPKDLQQGLHHQHRALQVIQMGIIPLLPALIDQVPDPADQLIQGSHHLDVASPIADGLLPLTPVAPAVHYQEQQNHSRNCKK